MPTIAVYTIALNEAEFAERWAKTVAQADFAFVADTGSTDDTIAILDQHRIPAQRIYIRPWRFDDARNAALALLPDNIDITVSLDMDETLTENWRDIIERNWKGTRLKYGYVWSWSGDRPTMTFLSDKIAGRFTHRWHHPVHEILVPTVPEVTCSTTDVVIEHHPDGRKSRGQYLDLLKIAVAEDPHDDRSAHYLGREYFFHRMYKEAIAEFQRHLALPSATWIAERASSLRYMGKCHDALGEPIEAYRCFMRAALEDNSRESWIDAARFSLARDNFHAVIDFCQRALASPLSVDTYMAERYANDEGPFDLAAVAHFHLGERAIAIKFATEALRRNPSDTRLKANLAKMTA
jgi:tetratricopeptide (TPR) repeat protein